MVRCQRFSPAVAKVDEEEAPPRAPRCNETLEVHSSAVVVGSLHPRSETKVANIFALRAAIRWPLVGRVALPCLGPPLSRHASSAAEQENQLAYEEFVAAPRDNPGNVDGMPTFVIIHGLLGQGRNWRTFATRLAREGAALCSADLGRRAILVDLRHHGKSPAPEGDPSLQVCAKDVFNLLNTLMPGRPPRVVIGHSLGGKVALEYCVQAAAMDEGAHSPKSLWVLDSNPGAVVESGDHDVTRVLQVLQDVPMPIASREALYAALEPFGFTTGLVQWLGSNLVPAGGGAGGPLTWAFNLEGAAAMYAHYCSSDYFGTLSSPPFGVEVNIVRAENSDRWTPDVVDALHDAEVEAEARHPDHSGGGSLKVHTLPKSGHWVHVDNPKGLQSMLLQSVVDMPPHLVY